MEIMGLAIVIILIIMGLLFVIRFVMVRKPAEFKSEFTQTQLTSNTINTFLGTTSRDCNGLKMTELLLDCAQSQTIVCENNKVSCEYVKNAAIEIFGSTLDSWNKNYHFTTYKKLTPTIFEMELGNVCTGSKKSKTYPISTDIPGNPLIIKLDICS